VTRPERSATYENATLAVTTSRSKGAAGGAEADYVHWLRTYYTAANRRSSDSWDAWNRHRDRLTSTILESVPAQGPGRRLCLLGAGNCNDVDLRRLGDAFAEIHLVDIDMAALTRAPSLQPRGQARIVLHGPVDLSGRLLALVSGGARLPSAGELDALVAESADSIVESLPGRFDAVASCCVLTQMGWALERAVGDKPAVLEELYLRLQRIHLRTMARLLAPEGQAFVITDMTASETYPLEEMAILRPLREIMDELTRQGNLFKIADPLRLQRALARDPVLGAIVRSDGLTDPWLWQGGGERTYLVYALSFRLAERA
jgi:hypothetical protein